MKLLLILLSVWCHANAIAQQTIQASEFYTATTKWFNAWQLVSKKIYCIPSAKEVDFVFFDESEVYATSPVTIPKGKKIAGPSLTGKPLSWKVAKHEDTLTLPDGKRVKVGLMSFASATKNGKPFFVMPLPSFWRNANVNSKELGLDNLLTGVFLQEFSHSQQVQSFGKQITDFEKATSFQTEVNDDMVQTLFKNDSAYIKTFEVERQLFYRLATNNEIFSLIELQNAVEIFRKRQQDFFNGNFSGLKKMDDVFLTMEGIGQHAMYSWLVHPAGANLPKEAAIQGVRRGGKWWSQDEGLALFLLLEKKLPQQNWGKLFFGTNLISVVNLLENPTNR